MNSSGLDTESRVFSTPMMQQYMSVKQAYPDCLVLFRLGDFYELFLDDAKIGAKVLGITLTRRSRGKDGDVPMAGIPYHALDNYMGKLVGAGYNVALCDQLSAPDGKTLVERDVVRVVTPGTYQGPGSLDKRHTFVSCWEWKNGALAVASADLSTGDVLVGCWNVNETELKSVVRDVLYSLNPAEILISAELDVRTPLRKSLSEQKQGRVSSPPEWISNRTQIKKVLDEHNEVIKRGSSVDKLQEEVIATLLNYLEYTQKGSIVHLKVAEPLVSGRFLQMDAATIRNLELLETLDGRYEGSLLSALDETKTAMGGRLLRQWLLQPVRELTVLKERLSIVKMWNEPRQSGKRVQVLAVLGHITDIDRLLGKISLRQGNARDLAALRNNLERVQELVGLDKGLASGFTQEVEAVMIELQNAIQDDPATDPKGGNFIKSGYDVELDRVRLRAAGGRQQLATLESRERERTGISSLKVRYNQVFGFYIEISKANLANVPADFERKQTLVNAERFTTPELKKYEQTVLTADADINEKEFALFNQLVDKIMAIRTQLQHLSSLVARLDCLVTFAEVSQKHHYTLPTLNTANTLILEESRHPVVERLLEPGSFVPNSIALKPDQPHLLLLTGPNMAGKSVLMRQVALATLLAHIGCFVPATTADIPLTDRIFVRSGASDRITAQQSTFMVEMSEAAFILKHATRNSLIIMDEIGRGTSTYDGISIAWAIAEYLISEDGPQANTLFATHYHELQELAELHQKSIAAAQMAIALAKGEPIFLYQLKPGGAPHSFGIAVAKQAGLPESVLQNAQKHLKKLETQDKENE